MVPTGNREYRETERDQQRRKECRRNSRRKGIQVDIDNTLTVSFCRKQTRTSRATQRTAAHWNKQPNGGRTETRTIYRGQNTTLHRSNDTAAATTTDYADKQITAVQQGCFPSMDRNVHDKASSETDVLSTLRTDACLSRVA